MRKTQGEIHIEENSIPNWMKNMIYRERKVI